MLSIGDKAPGFSAQDQNNTTVELTGFLGKKVVLYFYPKDDTPGCTREAIDFTATVAQCTALNCVVLGVSKDDVASHKKFCIKHSLGVRLLADTDGAICNAYDVIKEKNRYGTMVRGISRTTFLIDAKGTIAHIWQDVKVDGHIDDVLRRVAQ